jgi:predicted kinase
VPSANRAIDKASSIKSHLGSATRDRHLRCACVSTPLSRDLRVARLWKETTLARRLAAESRALRLSPDEWKHALGIDYYDEEARVRLEARLWQLAQELLTLGQSVVLEHGFWAREERDQLRRTGHILGATVELHYLHAPVDELWRRLELRNQSGAPGAVPIERSDLDRWVAQFEPPDAAELALFDPSE